MVDHEHQHGSQFQYINNEIDEPYPGSVVTLPYGFGPMPDGNENRKIFFFDIDNCLYQRSTNIHDQMQVKIHEYFKTTLSLGDEEAQHLHLNYYKTYGLAIEGLVRNHQVDALEYNAKVDDSLDLKAVLKPDVALREMLIGVKKHFDHFWLITNAYKTHALRVISFLGLGDIFDGLTFCDYAHVPIICKPMDGYFFNVFKTTRLDYKDSQVLSKQYFVDDSEINVKAALNLGVGHVLHYVEMDSEYESLIKKDDYSKFYAQEGESSSKKIRIIRNILDLDKLI